MSETPNLDAIGDQIWFLQHSARFYRARAAAAGAWIIRRAPPAAVEPMVLLRAWRDGPPPADNESACRAAWWHSAYPHGLPRRREKRR